MMDDASTAQICQTAGCRFPGTLQVDSGFHGSDIGFRNRRACAAERNRRNASNMRCATPTCTLGRIPADHRLAAARMRLWACAAVAAGFALLPAADASAQRTCFGKGSVLTCLDRSGGPPYQVTCFGSKQYRTCTSPSGQFTLSETPTNSSSASTTGSLQVGGDSGAAAPGADPAFGAPSRSSADPAFAR